MLKNKYQRMTKEEKRNLKQEFYATSEGKATKFRFLRVLIIGILCIVYAVIMSIDTYLHGDSFMFYIYSSFTALAGIIFIFSIIIINGKALNRYALKKGK